MSSEEDNMVTTEKDDLRNRLKIVSCDLSLILAVFEWCRTREGFLALPVTDEIPADVEIVSVQGDWSTRSIRLMIRHPSFDVVPGGMIPPVVPDSLCREQLYRTVDGQLVSC